MLSAKIWQEQGMRQKEISSRLGVCERTIRNYLNAPEQQPCRKKRHSKLDPFRDTVRALLEDNPYYNCELIFEKIVKAGYTGKISILRELAHGLRSRILTDAVIRFETVPGLQAQVDWKEFGRHHIDGREGKLYAFVMILGYSRMPFICFTESMRSSDLLRCHLEAFRFFGGVPSEILYDNMKTAFIADEAGVFHPQKDLLQFAQHYGFQPKRCRVRRPQTKGKVERGIGFMVTNFWPRVDKENLSISSLNEMVRAWVDVISDKRIGGLNESRRERFAVEKTELKPLPRMDLDIRRSVVCTVNHESCIMFETNKYSVHPDFIGQNVCLRITEDIRTADVYYELQLIRSIHLDKPGSRSIRIFEDDITAIRERHRADVKKRLRIMSRSRRKKSVVEVEARHPSIYDAVVGGVQ
jgi:transposase